VVAVEATGERAIAIGERAGHAQQPMKRCRFGFPTGQKLLRKGSGDRDDAPRVVVEFAEKLETPLPCRPRGSGDVQPLNGDEATGAEVARNCQVRKLVHACRTKCTIVGAVGPRSLATSILLRAQP